jgi:serine/threonine protein kinase
MTTPLTWLRRLLHFIKRSPDRSLSSNDTTTIRSNFLLDTTETQSSPQARPTTIKYLGDYEVEGEIARGGMGVVYRARQTSLKRDVALKVLPEGWTSSSFERFRRECQAAASLEHPNIVPIFEIGQHEGSSYFSMRLINGLSLHGLIRRRRLSQREISGFLIPIAHALHYAHTRGILHRDLKPSNVLIDATNVPYLTDFGIAHVADMVTLTGTGQILGTLAYMAPEQARGERVTARTDIYGLGAILYECLTGTVPHNGTSSAEVLRSAVENRIIAPSRISPRIDSDLETICLKCLATRPDARYESAAAVACDLQNWSEHRPIDARRPSVIRRAFLWVCRRPLPAVSSVAVLLVAAVVSKNIGEREHTLARSRDDVLRVTLAREAATWSNAVQAELEEVEHEIDELPAKLVPTKDGSGGQVLATPAPPSRFLETFWLSVPCGPTPGSAMSATWRQWWHEIEGLACAGPSVVNRVSHVDAVAEGELPSLRFVVPSASGALVGRVQLLALQGTARRAAASVSGSVGIGGAGGRLWASWDARRDAQASFSPSSLRRLGDLDPPIGQEAVDLHLDGHGQLELVYVGPKGIRVLASIPGTSR